HPLLVEAGAIAAGKEPLPPRHRRRVGSCRNGHGGSSRRRQSRFHVMIVSPLPRTTPTTEIYTSIQGETGHAGRPCTLVRTTGCDLRCTYCDTEYAFQGGEELELDEIVARVQAAGARLVLLTGGEPLLQRELPELAARLLALGFDVMCETGGSQDTAVLP